MPISRNLEAGGDLWINKWVTGLYTQRSPLFVPMSAMGLQMVNRLDALIDGQNMEIGFKMTLLRRPAYTRFSTVAFGAGDIPLNWHSFRNTSGTIYLLADTTNKVYVFTPTTNTVSFTKGTTARGSFWTVGDFVYYCNGTDTKKFDGTTWTNWGIAAPSTAPTLSFIAGSLSPKVGFKYGYVYVNTATGHKSAMSPASASTGPQTNQNVVVSYTASSDPQVNAIWIFRTTDGGGIFDFLISVANTTATYTDSTPDSGLNTAIVAPQSPNNDVAPTGSSIVSFWDGRLWVGAKNFVYFTTIPAQGVPEESFNKTNNYFKLPNNVTGFAPTSAGMMVFTSDAIYRATGAKGTYFMKPWQINYGVKQPNAIVQDGDLVFIYTSHSQLFILGDTMEEIGYAVRGGLSVYDPTKVSLAIHRNGLDEGLFLSDGTATDLWRYSIALQNWSPVGKPVQGAGVIGSIETSTGTWTLLLGAPTAAKFIGGRNLNSFTDDGGTYTCFATVGSIVISPPGKKAVLSAIFLNATAVGTYPTVAVLLNEISGNFAPLPNPVPEPPVLPPSQTISTKRHYFKSAQTPLPQQVEHMQVKISFVAENFQGEILALGIS